MRNILTALCLAATSLVPVVAHAEATTEATTTLAKYTVEQTHLGTMLDDPVAKAVLNKYIPELIGNEQIDMARSMTLKQLKQYAGDALTDEILTKIQADLDASAPK